jgi:hypothetical protein
MSAQGLSSPFSDAVAASAIVANRGNQQNRRDACHRYISLRVRPLVGSRRRCSD